MPKQAVARNVATLFKRRMRCEVRAGRKGTGRVLAKSGSIPLSPTRLTYMLAEIVAREQGYHVRVEDSMDTYDWRIVVDTEYGHCVHLTPTDYGTW